MEENSRFAVGLDIGTGSVRCVVGHIDSTGAATIVGVGQSKNSGMRKGTVTNLAGPAEAIDAALGEAERMSGYEVDAASLSINGSHILSTKTDGMIAVGASDHEINADDVARLEEVAIVGKVPANREVLEVVPHSFRLDGQDNIKDPLGMTGTRLEINANVVSVLTPYLQSLQKSAGLAKVDAHAIMPSVLAAAHAVLNESQKENGVALVDIGAATTGVAVFEDGDLQHVGVIAVGGNVITNDLAIGLKTDPEIAEKVKIQHASATVRDHDERLSIKHGKEILSFSSQEVDEITSARLEEIFEAVQKELKKAGRAGRLPSGVILVGGTANTKNIVELAKNTLGVAARLGHSEGFGGVSDAAQKPEFAAAIGLMQLDSEGHTPAQEKGRFSPSGASHAVKNAGGFISKLLKRFKA